MSRLRILVEGETEEDFVNEVLCPHFRKIGIEVGALHLGVRKTSRGIVSWQSAERHIANSLKEDPGLFVSTLVDYYKPKDDWPGLAEAKKVRFDKKAAVFQEHLSKAMADTIDNRWRPNRFIPFVMVHEFEALLFASPQKTARAVGMARLAKPMQKVRSGFKSPEEINDSEATAPSKRMEAIFEECQCGKYDKRLHGNIAVLEIGLQELRDECAQFGAWLTRLEELGR